MKYFLLDRIVAIKLNGKPIRGKSFKYSSKKTFHVLETSKSKVKEEVKKNYRLLNQTALNLFRTPARIVMPFPYYSILIFLAPSAVPNYERYTKEIP